MREHHKYQRISMDNLSDVHKSIAETSGLVDAVCREVEKQENLEKDDETNKATLKMVLTELKNMEEKIIDTINTIRRCPLGNKFI